MKYTKTAFMFVVALAFMVMVPSFAFAITVQDNGTTAAPVGSPAVQDNGNTASVISTPAVQNNGNTASTISTPAVQDNGNTSSTIATPAVQDNGNTASVISAPAVQDNGNTASVITSTNTGGGSTPSGSNSSSSNTSTGSSSSGGSAGGSAMYNTGCQLITGFLKFGGINSATEVTKLQTFLKNTENISVNITGVYDEQTVEAVKAFQTKYSATILAPWGVTAPSGQVFITTLKQINARACSTGLTLTPAELAQIEAFKTASVNGTATVSNEVGMTDGAPVVTTDSSTTTDTQVAAVAKAFVLSKFWNFIKHIFGR